MTVENYKPHSPESYATFWEPIALDPLQSPAPNRTGSSDPRDAYQDFVNVTEDVPVALRVEQI